ncbi:MAG: response regulator transcription factor [Myxococcota bacterium]
MRILFLEDDEQTAGTLTRGLEDHGFAVLHAPDVPAARALLERGPIDAAILDVRVPHGSGYDVLEAIRAGARHVPVLMLTALDSVADRVDGLERSADDYLVKPFAFAELLARLRALLRRPAQRVEIIRVDGLEIDPVRRIVQVGARRLDLTRTEFDLLLAFGERRGEVLNRRLLLELVWGYRFDPGTNVVDVHVNRLRRKLADVGHGESIRTLRGVGYALA